ncbi:hypothetical protein B0A55_11148 [Friedmanniomyces simplex]|uniref:ABM domain-containing protein n=1 Tax=Friedmanniomyces simplex TaxID=329884 RepID=A0A4U0WEF7_9PEZI|nr:hypothetical protein B0A55_11148 [Friedmanniomyces simplex]
MPTTEIAIMPLKAGADIGDYESPAASVLNNTFDTLRAMDGMQQLNFGTQLEDPSKLQLMITWDSLKHHQDFMASEAYGPFMQRAGAIVDGEVSIVHADFKPEGALSKAFSAPVTEVATFYFHGEPPSDYVENVGKLDKTLQIVDGYLGYAIGITHETVEKEDVKGKAAVVTIGWQTKEAHMAFRETQAFKDNIHLLRSESKKVTMWHVQFMQSV